jgi:phosphoglycolate phosphatase
MPPSAYLFILDLDGTLADSLDDLTVSVNVMRRVFQLPPLQRQAVRRMVGEGALVLVQRALAGLGNADIEAGLEIFLAHNEAHLYDQTRLYAGVADTLAALSAQGHTLALLSNKNEGLCRKLLQHFGVAGHFAAVAGADTMDCRKPSPEPVLRLMAMLGRSAGDTVMVGDSINDVAAGQGAGVVTVGCTYGYGAPSELAQASYRIATFAELLKLPLLAAGAGDP